MTGVHATSSTERTGGPRSGEGAGVRLAGYGACAVGSGERAACARKGRRRQQPALGAGTHIAPCGHAARVLEPAASATPVTVAGGATARTAARYAKVQGDSIHTAGQSVAWMSHPRARRSHLRASRSRSCSAAARPRPAEASTARLGLAHTRPKRAYASATQRASDAALALQSAPRRQARIASRYGRARATHPAAPARGLLIIYSLKAGLLALALSLGCLGMDACLPWAGTRQRAVHASPPHPSSHRSLATQPRAPSAAGAAAAGHQERLVLRRVDVVNHGEGGAN